LTGRADAAGAGRPVSAPRFPFSARAVVLAVDNVDTDQIIPARFLKTTDKTGLGPSCFADWRTDAAGQPRVDFALNRPEAAGAEILVAGHNFGCGSSREHAAWALLGAGFRAVISPRFADIFRNNALKNGLLPVALDGAAHRRLVDLVQTTPSATVTVDLARQRVTLPDGTEASFPIEPFAKRCLADGVDQLGFLLREEAAIAAYERAHPGRIDTTAAVAG
jgi:3-isopropylmalate/(R)-2-methylmalate dehydratase small subunit